jgi:hypothetical protein
MKMGFYCIQCAQIYNIRERERGGVREGWGWSVWMGFTARRSLSLSLALPVCDVTLLILIYCVIRLLENRNTIV